MFTPQDIEKAEVEITRARRQATTRRDWTLIQDCQRAVIQARLELARTYVGPLK